VSRPAAMRFSIQVPDAPDARTWLDKVRRADDLGFSSVSVPDHLGPSLPQLAPVAALAAAAAVTTNLRLAITVLDNDFRHPVMLAKEAATLDLVSDGRLDLGLGAGWLEEDYTKTGIATWDAPEVRVGRLFESIALLRELFTGEPVTFSGDHYTVTDFVSYPKPVQDPVPIMIGARGKRMLTHAARHAQIVSVLAAAVPGGSRLDGFEEQLAWVRDAGAGRDDLTVGIRIPFGVFAERGESTPAAAARVGERMGMTADDVIASPFVLAGDAEGIAEQLLATRERYGVTYVTVSEDVGWHLGPVIDALGR